MKKIIPILGILGLIILIGGVSFSNPYLLVAGIILIAIAIIQFTNYMNSQLPDLPDIPDLKGAKVTKLNVADLSHHIDDLLSLATPNPDYDLSVDEIMDKGLSDTMIYEFTFPDDLELKRGMPTENNDEPVEVRLGGKIIGSIPVKKSPYVYVLVGMKGIRYMETEITGGRYKIVHDDRLDTGKREYRVALTIYADA